MIDYENRFKTKLKENLKKDILKHTPQLEEDHINPKAFKL